MPHTSRLVYASFASAIAVFALSGVAQAQVFSNGSSYNAPYGMTQSETNAPVDPSLRDGNGNLELVNGQFLTSSMSQQAGVQNMNPLTGTGVGSQSMSMGSSTSGQVATSSGVGNVSTTGTATAIGNSLNVITVGNNNTVVVNSKQVNNGNQTATANVGGQ
jgi:holdfast attachment protein HfaA